MKITKPKDRPYFRPDSRGNGKMVDTGKFHCRSRNCRGVVDKEKVHSPYCSRCRTKRWREKFPLHYSFKNLRNRAKQRGKEFSLTREQYVEFAVKTDYARLKGKSSMSLSIDRKDNSRGYSVDNIRAITLSDNSRKQFFPFWAKQMENMAYEPSAEELASGDLMVLTMPMRLN